MPPVNPTQCVSRRRLLKPLGPGKFWQRKPQESVLFYSSLGTSQKRKTGVLYCYALDSIHQTASSERSPIPGSI